MRVDRNIKIALAACAGSAALVIAPAMVSAEKPTPVVPAHQHYVVTANGDLVPVGPNACSDGMSLQFDNFHNHIHRGHPFENGIISASGCPA